MILSWFIKEFLCFSLEPYIVPFNTAVYFIVIVMDETIIMHITSNITIIYHKRSSLQYMNTQFAFCNNRQNVRIRIVLFYLHNILNMTVLLLSKRSIKLQHFIKLLSQLEYYMKINIYSISFHIKALTFFWALYLLKYANV